MDSDRRSGYSQYYGNNNTANSKGPIGLAGAANDHARNDSMAGLPHPRASQELLGGHRNSYASSSPFKPDTGDDMNPEDGWNVYSDFNNSGPRYSSLRTNTDG